MSFVAFQSQRIAILIDWPNSRKTSAKASCRQLFMAVNISYTTCMYEHSTDYWNESTKLMWVLGSSPHMSPFWTQGRLKLPPTAVV